MTPEESGRRVAAEFAAALARDGEVTGAGLAGLVAAAVRDAVAAERDRCIAILLAVLNSPVPDGPYDYEYDYQPYDWQATIEAAIARIREGGTR